MSPKNQIQSVVSNQLTCNKKYSIDQYWALKVLVNLNWTQVSYSDDFSSSELCYLGLKKFRKDLRETGGDENEINREIRNQLNYIEKNIPQVDLVLRRNISKLVKVINLNETEIMLLSFAIVSRCTKLLGDILQKLGNLRLSEIYETLSLILNIPNKKIKKALNSKSTLFQSGLIRVDNDDLFSNLYLYLSIMDGLVDRLLIPDIDIDEIFEPYFYPVNKGKLTIKDYYYLSKQTHIIQRLLRNIKKIPVKGMNILLYGPPGTGKTEFAQAIAKSSGFDLQEIAISNEKGDPISSKARFSAFRLAQHVLKRKKNSLIVFDEIEDVFPQTMMNFFGLTGDDKGQKAWVNRLLENNKVPSIWISNAVDQIDDAYKRRFKFVIKMDIPPKRTRLRIIKNCVKSLPISSDWLNSLAENSDLSPALISQAAEMVILMNNNDESVNKNNGDRTNSDAIESDLTQILNNSLEVMDKKSIQFNKSIKSISYNIDALNPDRDLKDLITGLKKHQQGRICLYGPPGTGKTAFGQYIASKLDKKLLVKRASDILSKWVGEAESNIASMFAESEKENSILMIDEADSFLMDRKTAHQSWAITQVNELLTQMENYEGIFICSTNLIDNLDAASIRRFDLKIKLDYLHPKQAWTLFRQVIAEQGLKLTQKAWWEQQLNSYHNLTPGDFSTVVRQNRLSAEKLRPDLLLAGLKNESQFKTGNKRGIGFTASL